MDLLVVAIGELAAIMSALSSMVVLISVFLTWVTVNSPANRQLWCLKRTRRRAIDSIKEIGVSSDPLYVDIAVGRLRVRLLWLVLIVPVVSDMILGFCEAVRVVPPHRISGVSGAQWNIVVGFLAAAIFLPLIATMGHLCDRLFPQVVLLDSWLAYCSISSGLEKFANVTAPKSETRLLSKELARMIRACRHFERQASTSRWAFLGAMGGLEGIASKRLGRIRDGLKGDGDPRIEVIGGVVQDVISAVRRRALGELVIRTPGRPSRSMSSQLARSAVNQPRLIRLAIIAVIAIAVGLSRFGPTLSVVLAILAALAEIGAFASEDRDRDGRNQGRD